MVVQSAATPPIAVSIVIMFLEMFVQTFRTIQLLSIQTEKEVVSPGTSNRVQMSTLVHWRTLRSITGMSAFRRKRAIDR
jgi:hypothetical protein